MGTNDVKNCNKARLSHELSQILTVTLPASIIILILLSKILRWEIQFTSKDDIASQGQSRDSSTQVALIQ